MKRVFYVNNKQVDKIEKYLLVSGFPTKRSSHRNQMTRIEVNVAKEDKHRLDVIKKMVPIKSWEQVKNYILQYIPSNKIYFRIPTSGYQLRECFVYHDDKMKNIGLGYVLKRTTLGDIDKNFREHGIVIGKKK